MSDKDVVNVERSIKDGKIDLRSFITIIIQRLMGETLDLARMSEISDRAMDQLAKTVKRDFNSVINQSVGILEKYGYIEPSTENDKNKDSIN